jgi:hypothetical protein
VVVGASSGLGAVGCSVAAGGNAGGDLTGDTTMLAGWTAVLRPLGSLVAGAARTGSRGGKLGIGCVDHAPTQAAMKTAATEARS